MEQGCHRVAFLALYPQYAAPTTATAYDKAFEALMALRWQPAVRTMGPYHDEPGYIDLRQEASSVTWPVSTGSPRSSSCPITACPGATS